MRSTADRIRHAISFEIIGLALATPIGAWLFNIPFADIGVVTVIGATTATIWNYLYNLGFDHLMQRLRSSTRKTLLIRVIHAILFEVCLLAFLLPVIALYLQISVVEAFLMDVSFAAFYAFYALAFNWAYDRVFPLREWREAPAGG
ncbi:PACE efflux transporter [Aurantimonas marina]|uniref:PACE efflux transporter n=1 Tax=Aurantimonas marina TaxID=2780508 RepID=UPI0019CFB8D4|nr:PACE efflux transporter [Aurantimonas marina]